MSESLKMKEEGEEEKEQHSKDPATVLASTSEARTLTISNEHANILLTQSTTPSDNNGNNKALLKITLVPFHKKDLACLPLLVESEDAKPSDEDVAARVKEEKEHSSRVLAFLSKFDWRMTSESGAEYSFHEAFPKTISAAGGTRGGGEPAEKKSKTKEEDEEEVTQGSVFKAELIYPASERQVSRTMPSPGFCMITETPAMYKAVTKPFIDGIVSSGSLSWLQNIVQVKKEKERLLWNANGWILNIDTKWRTHPDALTVPRSEWHKHQSTIDLYCLGIIKEEGIASLRDLTDKHLPVLREMLEEGPKAIEKVYGISKDQLRIFVHYQPQFYHFHVHFTRLENETGVQVERAHLLSDIIQDLEADPECFQKRTLIYKLSLKDKLYKLLTAYEKEEK